MSTGSEVEKAVGAKLAAKGGKANGTEPWTAADFHQARRAIPSAARLMVLIIPRPTRNGAVTSHADIGIRLGIEPAGAISRGVEIPALLRLCRRSDLDR